jgi:hypothetical protein
MDGVRESDNINSFKNGAGKAAASPGAETDITPIILENVARIRRIIQSLQS